MATQSILLSRIALSNKMPEAFLPSISTSLGHFKLTVACDPISALTVRPNAKPATKANCPAFTASKLIGR